MWCQAQFKEIDTDGDGCISAEEWKVYHGRHSGEIRSGLSAPQLLQLLDSLKASDTKDAKPALTIDTNDSKQSDAGAAGEAAAAPVPSIAA